MRVMGENLLVPKARLEEFCRRRGIRKLAFFGSVLRPDFRPESDVDVLVEFEPGSKIGFFELHDLEQELSGILGGRKIDLRTPADLSRYFRDEVVALAEVQYAANDSVRLRHIQDASRQALAFVRGRSRADLDRDPMLSLALVRLLEIIGEAARGVSVSTRDSHPGIAWSQMAAMRDRLIHGYFDVNLDIVWQTVEQDLPPLLAQLEKILPPLPSAS